MNVPPIGMGCLRLVRDAVVAVLQPQAVPVRGGLGVAVVPYLDGDLRPLVDVERRTGDRVVVGEHAQLRAGDALANRMDGEVESIAVVKSDDGRARRLCETRRLGAEQVLRVGLCFVVHDASVLNRSWDSDSAL